MQEVHDLQQLVPEEAGSFVGHAHVGDKSFKRIFLWRWGRDGVVSTIGRGSELGFHGWRRDRAGANDPGLGHASAAWG